MGNIAVDKLIESYYIGRFYNLLNQVKDLDIPKEFKEEIKTTLIDYESCIRVYD